ncbi:hypothetical protein HZ320_02395 [[Pasteurella] aerogenes]|nr:hypothetical protein HZ320_02395 [[Pasteurella] aerogenes]
MIGSMLPQGLSSTLSTVKTVVSRGVEIYNQGKRAIDEVRNTVAVIRQLADDPISALAYLPGTITNLDSALENFGKLVGMQSGFEGVRQVLPVVAEFSRDVTAIYADLQQMKQNFSQANETGWEDWFIPSDNALTNINERVDNLNGPVANMTAWIVLRTDEENPNEREVNDDANRA